MNPLVRHTDCTLVLPPRYMGSIAYYGLMARYGRVIVDTGLRHDKRQKAVHRCDIADTRGPVSLTVPLAKPSDPSAPNTWASWRISTHDEWWRQHRISLESAYGRTPFFEFLFDRFEHLFRSPADWAQWPSAIDFDREADAIIRDILGFENEVIWADAHGEASLADGELAEVDIEAALAAPTPPYWQIRADKLGFIPGLSIVDLIFNLGPEAPLYLDNNF